LIDQRSKQHIARIDRDLESEPLVYDPAMIQDVDAVVIAGDVYDRAVPPALQAALQPLLMRLVAEGAVLGGIGSGAAPLAQAGVPVRQAMQAAA
jgi:transcriptional regulator GlxA family with amidase domain